MSLNQTNTSSTRNESWETPQELYNRLDSIFYFVADLCASKENAKENLFISAEIDIMSTEAQTIIDEQTYLEHYLWINPPYKPNGKTAPFVSRALDIAGDRGLVCLIPSATGNKWWQEIVYPGFDSIVFPRRFGFKGAGNNALFDCAICIKWSKEDVESSDVITIKQQLISQNIGALVDIIK